MVSWAEVVHAVRDQPLRGGVEVVEDVLLGVAHAVAVPLLALLRATAQVGDGVDHRRPRPTPGWSPQ